MAGRSKNKISCPSCGFKNAEQSDKGRCVSCGASLEALAEEALVDTSGRHYQQGFSILWFIIGLIVMAALTAAVIIGLPRVAPIFDLEGYAGMMMSIPVWALGGVLLGLISPGRTFAEAASAAFCVAIPTAAFLFQGQVVKTMPIFMYVLYSALGVLFALVGAYLGERIQMGPEKATE